LNAYLDGIRRYGKSEKDEKNESAGECPVLFLAPMAGFTDRAMRVLCRENGADHVTTEMISSKAVFFGDKKTYELCRFGEEERPCSLQIFGDDPGVIAYAVKELLARGNFYSVDVNMGCPVPKVVKNHEGSALMRDPDKIYAIVARLTDSVGVPVTVKLRAGWNAEELNAPDAAEAAEKGGASAVFVHGRTRDQMYRPGVLFDVIRAVKERVGIPVIGNGDVSDPASAREMIEKTGCDALMIGRAALARPWLFNEIKCAFIKRGFSPPDIRDVIMRNIELKSSYKDEITALNELRGQIPHYIKGLPGAAAARGMINSAASLSELVKITDDFFGARDAGNDRK